MEGFAAPLQHFTTSASTMDSQLSFPQYRHQHMPIKVAMPQKDQNLPSYWTSISADIEANLKQAVQVKPPLSVHEPMYYLVFSAPRTMAPALSVAACELVGGCRETALPAASVLHLMYAATTVHERLIHSGRVKVPNGNFTDQNNYPFPAGVELLTGDGILSFGYELLARPFPDYKPDRILKVILEITRAMGAQGMVEEQYLQLQSTGSALGKIEGGLSACGAACGAILGGATVEEIERLRSFGGYVGTMHGMITSMDSSDVSDEEKEGLKGMMKKIRSMALKELEYFHHQPMVDIISSILHFDEGTGFGATVDGS